MSSSLYSLFAQSGSGSDWNWLLIFIIVVVILIILLVLMAKFSKPDAEELEHHLEEEPAAEAAAAETAVEEVEEVAAEPEAEVELDTPEKMGEPIAVEAEAVEEAAAPPDPEDLKKIEGIGPKVASLLIENGILTFSQLADTSVEKLDEILDANKLQMMNPKSWPEQARLAADGAWEALEELQDKLKGGL